MRCTHYSIDNLLSRYISYSHCCIHEFKLVIVCMMDRIYINGFTISKKRFQFHAIISVWDHCDLRQLWKVRAHTSFFLLACRCIHVMIYFRNSPCHACVVTNTKRQIKLWTKIYCIWSYCDVTVEYKKIYLYISIYIHIYIHT